MLRCSRSTFKTTASQDTSSKQESYHTKQKHVKFKLNFDLS